MNLITGAAKSLKLELHSLSRPPVSGGSSANQKQKNSRTHVGRKVKIRNRKRALNVSTWVQWSCERSALSEMWWQMKPQRTRSDPLRPEAKHWALTWSAAGSRDQPDARNSQVWFSCRGANVHFYSWSLMFCLQIKQDFMSHLQKWERKFLFLRSAAVSRWTD